MNRLDAFERSLDRRVRNLEAQLHTRFGDTGLQGAAGAASGIDGTWGLVFYSECITASNVVTPFMSWPIGPGEIHTAWVTIIGKTLETTYDYLCAGKNLTCLRGVNSPSPHPAPSVPGAGISNVWSTATGGLVAGLNVTASAAELSVTGKLGVPTKWRAWVRTSAG